MEMKTRELTGMDKASVLMMSLGASVSAKVFERLSEGERELLGAHIAGLRHVDEIARSTVFEEISEMLKSGSIPEGPDVSDQPLKWLETLNPEDVAKMLAKERAQNVALVLAHLAPQAAARVLSCLDENSRDQAAHRLATMRTPSQEVVEAVDEVMRKRAAQHAEAASGRKNRETLMGILSSARQKVKGSIVGKSGRPLELKFDASVANLEDLTGFSDSQIRIFISRVDSSDLALAMRVASDDLKSAILRNASEELSLTIHRELASLLQVRLKEVELAQERIVDVMKEMRGGLAIPELEAAVE